MTDCPRLGKFFGGCRFEARYDEPVVSEMEQYLGRDSRYEAVPGTTKLAWVKPPLGDRIYVQDVCIRCGKVVERTVRNERSEP